MSGKTQENGLDGPGFAELRRGKQVGQGGEQVTSKLRASEVKDEFLDGVFRGRVFYVHGL